MHGGWQSWTAMPGEGLGGIYRIGSQTPLSVGLATASFNGAVIGKFRFTFLGGIGLMNHFA